MTIDGKLLEILCCPVTHAPVVILSAARLQALNAEIAKGAVRNNAGETLTRPLAAALVTESKKTVYPVDDGIPVMLAEQGINTDQLPDGVL